MARMDNMLDLLIYSKLSQKWYREQWEFTEGRESAHNWGDSGRTKVRLSWSLKKWMILGEGGQNKNPPVLRANANKGILGNKHWDLTEP